MNEQLNCIMLIDDNKIDNFFHERVIKKANAAKNIISVESGQEALDYLLNGNNGNLKPELIFLDINMPGMNGWEFLEHYKQLDKSLQSGMVVVMLSTSQNPDDMEMAKTHGILSDFKTKPLTKEMLEEVLAIYRSKREN